MKTRTIIVTSVLAILSGLSVSTRAQTKIESSGSTVIKTSSPKGTAIVVIHTARLEGEGVKNCPAAAPWGELGVKEISVVQSISISVAGNKLAVPSSVYLGLSEAGHASMRYTNGSFVLELTGGDASEAYRMRVSFDRTGVNRRMLYDAEADQLLEDTRYHHVVME